MQNRKEILSYLDTISLIVLSVVFFLFPLMFLSITSDTFVLPKQLLLGVGVLISLILLGARTILEGKLRLRSTPFDIPIFLFAIVLFVSSYLSVNRLDSLISFMPLLYAILLYFLVVNLTGGKKAIMSLCGALLLGTGISALIAVLSFFKIYILPMSFTQVQFFSTAGSLLDQALLFGIVLPLAAYMTHPVFSAIMLHGKADGVQVNKLTPANLGFGISFLFVALGLIVTLFQLSTSQNPLILPFWEGLQHGLSSISRDTSRTLQSFLFGSGYGTYLTDFTRFKEASYNTHEKLWSFSFFRSSTYFFELLATTGFIGAVSYLFIIYRVIKEKWFFLPLFMLGIASFFLPLSYVLQAMMFIILAIFALIRAQQNPRKYPITDLSLVALNQGLLSAQTETEEKKSKNSLILPVIFCLLLILVIGTLGYISVRYTLSDITFQKSLVAASKNDGSSTYQLQREAITMFPYRDAYYRVFSQTNLALANNLAAAQPKGSSPSAETQQTILTLIQQSINSGRSAVTLSPLTSLNWNNLSSIYRSLIGFGENADQFSVLTNRQAIALDPNNPQQYINLGGIYYQLGQWEEAQRNFQIAANLKPDYPNAYYNLGHALESKGDLKNALLVYQQVASLVSKDPGSKVQIEKEIAALQEKIKASGDSTQPAAPLTETERAAQDLGVNQPTQQLPERNPKVQIPGVSITVSPTPKITTSPVPSGVAPTGQVSPTSPVPTQ